MASNTASRKAQSKATKPAPGEKDAGIAVPAQGRDTPLNEKQKRFVDEYMVDLNATQAAIRAGYSVDSAALIGHENLRKPNIQTRIAACRQEQQERTGVKADRVLMEIAHVALADARELVEVRIGCCRCCYGEGNRHQRTVGEMNRDRETWAEKGKDPSEFDVQGGIGFDRLKPPNPNCPACAGDGSARVIFHDTRSLSPQAAALYAGAKETKDGFEIKLHSKMDALEKLAKHVGLYAVDNAQRTDAFTTMLMGIASGNSSAFMPVNDDPERED